MKSLIVQLSLLAIMAALAMPGLGAAFTATRWVFTIAAGVNLAARVWEQADWKELDTRLRRLHRLELWSGVFFGVAAGFMWMRSAAETDWVAFTLAGAVLVIYASIAISIHNKKNKTHKP